MLRNYPFPNPSSLNTIAEARTEIQRAMAHVSREVGNAGTAENVRFFKKWFRRHLNGIRMLYDRLEYLVEVTE